MRTFSTVLSRAGLTAAIGLLVAFNNAPMADSTSTTSTVDDKSKTQLFAAQPVEQAKSLPPFPAGDPAQWVCADSPPPPTAEEIAAWCNNNPDRGQPAELPSLPASIGDLEAKNAYDFALRDFLRGHDYRALGWVPDREWRLTGPLAGDFPNPKSYGVHPAVRVWYSPAVADWLCDGRPDRALPDGAMIIKEMHAIDAKALDIDPAAECAVIGKPADQINPTSWTVMVRDNSASHDGWYWANPTASGDGNPPILTQSAVTSPDFFGPDPQHPARDPNWYPTGDLFGANGHKASIVSPYNLFGGYCMNCHASASSLFHRWTTSSAPASSTAISVCPKEVQTRRPRMCRRWQEPPTAAGRRNTKPPAGH
ncbi:MAG: hypothetical protein LC637_07890 [Xanthomonadaceae bacterium]|nr:hypothetical protein [Xanthomonadaceae bacterium]